MASPDESTVTRPKPWDFKYYNGGIKWVSLADSKRLDNGLISETEISEEGINNSSAVLHGSDGFDAQSRAPKSCGRYPAMTPSPRRAGKGGGYYGRRDWRRRRRI